MDELKGFSGGTSREERVPDENIVDIEATQATSTEQPSSNNSLAKTGMTSEVESEHSSPMVGGDDQMDMSPATDVPSNATRTTGNITDEADTIAEPVVAEELGTLGDINLGKTTILISYKPVASKASEIKNRDSDMIESAEAHEADVERKKSAALAPSELERSGASETENYSPEMIEHADTQMVEGKLLLTEQTEVETSEPPDKDKMDVDAPTTGRKKAEEDVEEEVETTDSKVWSLPSIVDDGFEPQLSLKQLLIMALVTSPTRTLSMEGICQWINDGFKYYKDQTFQHTLNSGGTLNWMKELNDILHRYDFPTEPVWKTDEGGENGKVVLYLPPGREWHILPKPDKMKAKPFRFMDLPFDLRLMILEFALVRPVPKKQGWIIDPEYTAKRKENYRKSRRIPQRLKASGPHGWELRTDGLDVVLAVLSVSKQVYAEAAPVFYRGNFLEFDSAVTMSRFLDGVPFRKKWIRNLILHYDPPNHGHACTRTFTLLRETKLRNLHLFLNEDKLIKRHELTRFGDPIPRLPGMKALAELRGLSNVAIHGPCARTNKFLSKITEYKKNDSKDDDELSVFKRKMEQEKLQLALKRSFNDLRAVNHKRAVDTLKAKHAREKEVQKRKREEERKAKADELATEKKARQDARETKRKERDAVKASSNSAKATLKKNGGKKVEKPAEEDTSSEEEEEDVSPPPPKRAKTLPATAALAAAKRNAASNNTKFPLKPAPAPRPVITKSATGVRSVATKRGIIAKGSSGASKKAAPAPMLKKAPVREFAAVKLKKAASQKRKSNMASVFEKSEKVVEDSD